mgnify:FL=1
MFSDYIYFGLIIALLILLVVLLYLIRSSDEHLEWEDNHIIENTKNDQSDIIKIAREIASSGEQLNIDLTPYEMKEEEDSIISYNELVKRNKNRSLNYEEENSDDDLQVKKVDIISAGIPTTEEIKFKPLTLSYEKEEALLEALKQLQKNLS